MSKIKIVYVKLSEEYNDIKKITIPQKGIVINTNYNKNKKTEIIYHPICQMLNQ